MTLEQRREVDGLLSHATAETTTDGFVYYVARPEDPINLTQGYVHRTTEQSDLTLIVNGNVPYEYRPKIASVLVEAEMHLDQGRYWLANAVDKELRCDDVDAQNHSAVLANMLFRSIRNQNESIQTADNISPDVKRKIRDEAKSTLGALALFKGVNPSSAAIAEEYFNAGLYVPHIDTADVEMTGLMKTKRGMQKASFKMMTEKSERHTCACCSSQILQNTNRMTVGLDRTDGYSDHHHYHYYCFFDNVLPKFALNTITEQPATYS